MRNSLAKAVAAAAVLGLLPTSPAPAAEKKAESGPKVINPKIVIVVECVRRADAKAARDFIACMTREPPRNIMVVDADGKLRAASSQRERFSASASLGSARKRAEREKAVAIVHVNIIKRAPETRTGPPEMWASCSVLLPSTPTSSGRISWKVKKKAMIVPPPHRAGSITLSIDGIPVDFVQVRKEITRLTYDAAIEITMPRILKVPKRGESVKATITNNTLLGIVALTVSNASHGKLCRWEYSGDALPPGRNEVALEARLVRPGYGRDVVPDQPARVEDTQFAEAARKK